MTPQDKFKAAVARGMKASPFASTASAPLVLVTSAGRRTLVGCVVNEEDNAAKAAEYGLDRKYTLEAHIPKSILATIPHRLHDKLEYQGRIYDIDAVSGAASYSPSWVVEASSPLAS